MSSSNRYQEKTGHAIRSVVRVENVSPGITFDGSGTPLEKDYVNSPEGIKGQLSSSGRNSVNGLEYGSELDDAPSEAEDLLYPLPDGWPKIPEIFERRSWDFSTSTCPSINKATAHLELLQNVIEDWSVATRNNILSRASSRATEVTKSRVGTEVASLSAGRRQIQFTPSSSLMAGSRQHTALSSRTVPPKTPALSIQGIGADIAKGSTKPEALPFEFEIPYLGAGDVIDEVITLLAKLENDRRETKHCLKQEKYRVETLGNKIDYLSEQRLLALPEAVQSEHEACAMDINELNWHVSYRGRVQARIQNKANTAEALNTKLKEDIAHVQKHCPLVKEKLDLERDAMDRIQQAQSDTNDELQQTTDRCSNVNEKSNEAHVKADQERRTVKGDLDNVREDLNAISDELSEAKMKHNTYVHMCHDYRERLKENEQELIVLQVKHDNAMSAEAMQATKVKDLNSNISEQEVVHRKLEDENYHLMSRLELQRKKNKTTEEDMKLGIMKSEDKLRNLVRGNQELDMEIEDHTDKINECDKQKIADEKNLVRIEKEMERTKESIKITEEDLFNVRTINRAIKEKLYEVEDRALMKEEGMKARAEALRKQVKEEIHSKTVIQSRIQSDSTDLVKDQDEIKKRKETIAAKVQEVDLVVKSILDKVMKLRSAHEEKTTALRQLTDIIHRLERERTALLERVSANMAILEPKHKEMKAELLSLDKRVDHMEWKTDMMNKNMDDMMNSSAAMHKSMAKTQIIIDDLRNEADELTIKINAGEHLYNQLQAQLEETTGRMREGGQHHRHLIEERRKVLVEHKSDLGKNLALNKELASTYRRLQNQFVSLKNDVLNHLDGRVQAETSVKDLKKVQGLQKRMQASLNVYYKLRGLYNRTELKRMEVESTENTRKVGELKEEINSALSGISKFIQTQMEGTVAKQKSLRKVQIQEVREQKNSETNASIHQSNGGAVSVH